MRPRTASLRHILLSRVLPGIVLALLILALGLALPLDRARPEEIIPLPALPGTVQRDAQAELELAHMLDDIRAQLGLRPLRTDPGLAARAADEILRIAQSREFGHDAGGEPLAERIASWGLPPRTLVGEVLAIGSDAPSAFRLLMASPRHRALLLSPLFCRIGWGAATSPWGLIVAGELAGC
jgi:uncharacterized protein YkwD